jgi:streptogramin lyase
MYLPATTSRRCTNPSGERQDRLLEISSRRLAVIVTGSLVGWSCQPPGQTSEPDGSADASIRGEGGTEAPDAMQDATEAEAADGPGQSLGADATLSEDSGGGGGAVDAAQDAAGPDAASMDAACSLAAQHLVITSTTGASAGTPFVVRATCNDAAGTTVDPTPSPNGFTFTNSSAGPVTWTAQVSSAYFSLDNVGSTLAAGDSVTVTVSAVALHGYPPGETTDDTVVVTENDPNACAHSLPIQEAFEGYFFLPASLLYGDVALGSSSTLHVSATFTGVSDLAGVLSASPTTDFVGSVQAGPGPVTGLDVAFTPSALGPRSGTVSFTGYMSPICTPPIAASGIGVPAPPTACASLDGGAPCGNGGVCVGAACTTQLGSAGISFSFSPGSSFTTTVDRVKDAVTDEAAAALSATIDWGDGNTSAGTISGGGGEFTVSGTHTYATATILSGTVTVTDEATGNSTVATFDAGPAIPVTTFPVGGELAGIVTGSDGNLWFPSSAEIAQMTTSGVVTTFQDFAVDAGNDLSTTRDITLGPDGNLWFAAGANVGRSSNAGVTASFMVPGGTPGAFTAGPDGNVWFTEPAANQIGRISPTGAITEFPVPTVGSSPAGIATGADGNVWFTEFDGQKIGHMTPAGAITEVALSAGIEPENIVAGPDGNLWFTDYNATTISRITPAGVVTPFTIPGSSTPGSGGGLTVGGDGNLWLTSGVVHRVSRITPSGVISVYYVPNSAYGGIAAGSDGNLWATDNLSGEIARITPPSP